MFAMTDNHHHGSAHCAVWVKAPPTVQEILVGPDPKRFFKPPYVGHKGWVGVRLDVKNVDWEGLAGILEEGYLMSAPKRLVKLLGHEGPGVPPAAPKTRAKRPKTRRHRSRADL
jgi:hypothetical protein